MEHGYLRRHHWMVGRTGLHGRRVDVHRDIVHRPRVMVLVLVLVLVLVRNHVRGLPAMSLRMRCQIACHVAIGSRQAKGFSVSWKRDGPSVANSKPRIPSMRDCDVRDGQRGVWGVPAV